MKTLASRNRKLQEDRHQIKEAAKQTAVADWQPLEIRFVHHSDFDDHEAVHNILEAIPQWEPTTTADRRRRLIGEEYLLPNRPLLTATAEKALFLRMNLFRYIAARRQDDLLSGRDPQLSPNAIRYSLEDANRTRNQIVEANQRLVISNANGFTSAGIHLADLIGEGNLALMKAIDSFDVSRGYRLSTYATYAIRRHLSRFVQREQKRKPISGEDLIEPWVEGQFVECVDCEPEEYIDEILASLPRRERMMVRLRYGLTPDGKSQTLHRIAEQFGISKERVRQLIVRSCAQAFDDYAKKLGYQ